MKRETTSVLPRDAAANGDPAGSERADRLSGWWRDNVPYNLPIVRAMEVLDPLFEGSVTAVLLDLAVSQRAAEIRARHYHRSRRPISLADAVLIASARRGDRIATADPDVLAVAKAEKLAPIALPGQG
jgi:predicted nucleic acid-binding protein